MTDFDKRFRTVAAEQNQEHKYWFSLRNQKQCVLEIAKELCIEHPEMDEVECVERARKLVNEFYHKIYSKEIGDKQ